MSTRAELARIRRMTGLQLRQDDEAVLQAARAAASKAEAAERFRGRVLAFLEREPLAWLTCTSIAGELDAGHGEIRGVLGELVARGLLACASLTPKVTLYRAGAAAMADNPLAAIAAECLEACNGDPVLARGMLRRRAFGEPALMSALVGPKLATLVERGAMSALQAAAGEEEDEEELGSRLPVQRAGKGHQASDAVVAGYELMALTNARSLLEHQVVPGLLLRDATTEVLAQKSAQLGHQARRCAIVSSWYGKIAAKLPVHVTVGDALAEDELRELLNASVAGDDPSLGPPQGPDRARLMAGR